MTDTTDTTTADTSTDEETDDTAASHVDTVEDTTGDDADSEATDDTGDSEKSGREAAKYRRRLRETEAQRDALAEQLSALRQGVIDDIATTAGVDPKLLAANGYELASFLDGDGKIIRAKVDEAIQATIAAFRISTSSRPAPDPAFGRGGHVEPKITGETVLRNAFGAE
ncbi:Uncharacterised protein [Mycobacteroides abscessus subsp. bolletii]|uniref:hypothetical protein n=1 Tax=Mycobacteroides abscessus TaxID=36809 RepID=UPI00092BD7C1|nr:hypothetical protein [Mycobacteroides abscessus]SHZ35894.1 Uncharacterised protein [Mycobacteroides abscessus subsp. bolletii]SIB00644.1 Uncharacterised protein [Mycobacteroides abscessus subsp. bolletii]